MAAAMQMPAADAHKDSQPGLIFITYLCPDVLLEAGTFLHLSSRGQEGSKVRARSPLFFWHSKTKGTRKPDVFPCPWQTPAFPSLQSFLTSALIETTSHSPLPCLAEVAALSIASL